MTPPRARIGLALVRPAGDEDGGPRCAAAPVYQSLDQNERSAALLLDALALSERHDGIPHPNQALFLTELANIEMFAGRSEESRRWLDRAEPVFRALGDTTSLAFAHSLKVRGNLVRRGPTPDFRRAAMPLERSAALFRARYPHDQGRLGALFYLAQTLRSVDAADRAEASCRRGRRPGRGVEACRAFDIPNAYSLRAAIRESNGDLRGADGDYAAATTYYGRPPASAFLTLQNVGLHGMTLLEMGQRDRGLQMIETSTASLAKTRAGSNTHAAAVERLGIAYVLVGSFERADPLLEEARALLGKRHDDLVRTGPTVYLAVARAERGRYQEARALLDEALAVRRERAHVSRLPVAEVHLTRGLVALDEDGCSPRPDRAGAGRHAVVHADARRPVPSRAGVCRAGHRGTARRGRRRGTGGRRSRGNLRRRAVVEPDPAAAGDGARGEGDEPLSIRAGARGGAAAGACRGERGGAVLARKPAAGAGVAAPCRVPGGARAHR